MTKLVDMATNATNSPVEVPPSKDRKEMASVTDTVPKEEEAESSSYSDYHIDPVKESKMMRKFDV